MNALFKFEDEFGDGLRCVPMAVRMKLDLTGVKLDLRAWVKFTEEERRELLALPAETRESRIVFRDRARALAWARTDETPKDLAVPAKFPWEESAPPLEVVEKAKGENVPLDKWPSLTPLQRFALVKLSRPSHENKNFLPACREFGLQ